MSNISATVKSIQDIMRQDAGIDGDAQRIGQLTWLLFLKIFDDRELEAELLDADYRSPIPDVFRWRTWAAPREGITGDELLDFVNNKLFPTLKAFAESVTSGRGSVVGNVFQDAFNYMKNGTLIRQVVNKINEIDFNRSEDRHVFGDIYEQILKDLQSAGNSGEYYTPRAVTQFMVDMVDPKLGEKVLDPACGTGGFLTCAIEHVRSNDVKTPDDEAILQSTVRGVEKKQLPHLLCTTNMLLHGIDVPTNIVHDNTLARPLRDYTNKDRVDVIITNPPFGGTEEPGIKDNFPQAFRTSETADLFLVLIEHLLKDGGRAAVVLPDGTLFGDGVKARIKEKLLTNCNLHTVVRLPKGVFNPYTPTATNILFFTKGQPTSEIWYYEHQYPAGYKNYSKTKPIRIEEFEAEKEWWNNRAESDVSWKVSIDEIKDGWNLDIGNPNRAAAEHRDPNELLKEYEALMGRIDATRASLCDALVAAIGERVDMDSKTFVDAFSHIVDTPEGIGRIRTLILDLAVHGRLTPQDPVDVPSTDLLGRIAAARDRMIKAGQIRKRKALPEVSGDERPFLPKGWACVRFGELFSRMGAGSTPAGGQKSYVRDGVIFLRSQNVHNSGLVLEGAARIPESTHEKMSGTKVAGGDILLNITGASIGRTAIVPLEGWTTANVNQHVSVLRPLIHESTEYLHLMMTSPYFQRLIAASSPGASREGLAIKRMELFPVPLPPLAEQHRIAKRVRKLKELCDDLEQQLVEAQVVRTELATSVVAHAI